MAGTTVTIRPASHGGGTGWTITGGSANIETALADDSDSTYVQTTSAGWANPVWLRFGTVGAIPAGAQIRSVTCRVRQSGGGTVASAYSLALVDGTSNKYLWIARGAWAGAKATRSFGAVNRAPGGGSWSASKVNDLILSLSAAGTVPLFYAVYLDVLYNERPAVTVTAPTGEVSGSRPTVTWTYSDPDGDPQERVVVRVFSDATVSTDGFDPDISTAAYDSGVLYTATDTHTLTAPVSPGAWWVYVKAADAGSGGRFSLWDASAFSITGAPPAIPTVVSSTSDTTNRRNVLVVEHGDNLLAYNQASFENVASDGHGWYSDTNATLTTGTTTAAGAEGTLVLRVTATSAALSRIRCGGTWATAGYGGSQTLKLVSQGGPPAIKANSGTTTLTSPSFTPPAASTLFAFMAEETSGVPTPTITSSPSRTWTKIIQCDSGVTGRRGAVAVWRSSEVPSAVPYTVSLTHTDGKRRSLHVAVLTGVDAATPVGTSGRAGTTGVVSASYTSTRAGSWGWLAYCDWNARPIPGPVAGAIVSTGYRDPYYTATTLRRASSTSLLGSTVSLSSTAPSAGVDANWAYVEIMPATTSAVEPLTSLAGVPVVAGVAYTKSARVWMADNVSRTARVDYEWYDVTGTIIGSTNTGATVATSTGTAMVETSEDITAPTGAVCCVLLPCVTNPSAGQVAHWDQFGLTAGTGRKWARGGMVVQNMLDADDGSQQSAIGSWTTVAGDTWSNVARVADATVKSGQILRTYITSGPHSAQADTGSLPGVEEGRTYTFSADAKTAAGTPNGWAHLSFEDDTGKVLSTTAGQATHLGSGAWQLLTVTATAPVGATRFRVKVSAWLTTTGVGQAVSWTRLAVTHGETPPLVWQPGPAANTWPLVEYSDDGDTWTEVRDVTAVDYDPSTGQATVADYEAPPGAARWYRAATAGLDFGLAPVSGLPVASASTEPVSVTLPADGWWLKDPQTPGDMLQIDVQGDLKWGRKRRQASLSPLGRDRPVVVFDATEGRELPVEVWFDNRADFDRFETWLEDGQTLLLQSDQAEQWYVQPGDTTSFTLVNAPGRLAGTPLYQATTTFTEVDRP